MKKLLCAAALALSLGCLSPSLAVQAADAGMPQAGKAQADKPVKTQVRVTSVAVVNEGTDSIGARLATRLKETFNQSNLFVLNEKDEPKLQLLIMTQPEFPGRPHVGSVYSVCWVFKQGEGYLGFLLSREVGTLNMEEVDELVAKLVERTDGIAAKYENLWK